MDIVANERQESSSVDDLVASWPMFCLLQSSSPCLLYMPDWCMLSHLSHYQGILSSLYVTIGVRISGSMLEGLQLHACTVLDLCCCKGCSVFVTGPTEVSGPQAA
jgi:hypothetical protein